MPTTDLGIPYWAGADPATLADYFQQQAEATDAAIPIRSAKKSIIPAEQSRTNAAYGYLGTEDKVTGIVLPTDGLIVVAYNALWKESVDSAARAAIFLGSDQLKGTGGINFPTTAFTEGVIDGGSNTGNYVPLLADSGGLVSMEADAVDAGAPVTTGQTVGGQRLETYKATGICHIFAAAGTYDVGVKFKASSGSVTAKERKLWVWTLAFD